MHHISSIIIALSIAGSLAQLPEFVQLEPWANFTLSVPRANITALTVNNYAVLAGGSLRDNTESTTVDVLDLSTKNITQTNMSVARSRILAVSAGKYAIFAGGYNQTIGGSSVNIVEVLDVDTRQWKSTQFPEEFFSNLTSAASTDSLAVFFNGTHLAFYDPTATDAGAWNISEAIFTVPKSHLLVTLGSVVYGFNLDSSFAYDILAAAPTPTQPSTELFNYIVRRILDVFARGTYVYIATDASILIYDTQLNLWQLTYLPQFIEGSYHILILPNNVIAVFTNGQLFSTDVLTAWYATPFDMADAAGFTSVTDKYIVIAGGYDKNDDVTDVVQVWQYTPSTPSAGPVTTPNTASTSSAHQIIGSVGFVIMACIFSMMVRH